MIKPLKELGQNFLKDVPTVKEAINALEITGGDIIVEIGPGLGALSFSLADKISSVSAKAYEVEIDERLAERLASKFAHNSNMQVVTDDILSWLPKFDPGRPYKVLGSLPYYITSPILHTILRHPNRPILGVLLVQKEVAEKIYNIAPKGSYLSTIIHTFYDVEIVKQVPRYHFDPIPQVDGTVIRMRRKETANIDTADIGRFEKFLHMGFAQPRKMLNKVFSKEKLEGLNINASLRPQHLELAQWLALYKNLRT